MNVFVPGRGGRSKDKSCVAKALVIRVENPCNTCDHGARILERIDLIGQILFGVLRPCKGLLYEGEKLGRRGQVPGSRTQNRSSSRPSREESIPMKFRQFCLWNC